eukprot:m51a1_g11259 hypothetical protein (487) ;mRNA; r:33-8732
MMGPNHAGLHNVYFWDVCCMETRKQTIMKKQLSCLILEPQFAVTGQQNNTHFYLDCILCQNERIINFALQQYREATTWKARREYKDAVVQAFINDISNLTKNRVVLTMEKAVQNGPKAMLDMVRSIKKKIEAKHQAKHTSKKPSSASEDEAKSTFSSSESVVESKVSKEEEQSSSIDDIEENKQEHKRTREESDEEAAFAFTVTNALMFLIKPNFAFDPKGRPRNWGSGHTETRFSCRAEQFEYVIRKFIDFVGVHIQEEPNKALLQTLTSFTVESVQSAVQKEQEAAAVPKKDKDATDRILQNFEKSLQKTQTAALRVETDRARTQLKEDTKRQGDIEEAKKKPILTKINRYLSAFPSLSGAVPKVGPKASLLELQEVLNIIPFMALETTWNDGSKAPTWVPPQLRFNLKNITAYYRQGMFDKEIEPIITEIDIEYPWLGRQSLFWRGLEAVSEAITHTHFMNTYAGASKILGESAKVIPEMDGL